MYNIPSSVVLFSCKTLTATLSNISMCDRKIGWPASYNVNILLKTALFSSKSSFNGNCLTKVGNTWSSGTLK